MSKGPQNESGSAKLRFSTSTKLLAMAVVAVFLGGTIPYVNRLTALPGAGGASWLQIVEMIFRMIASMLPLFAAPLLVAYALGRRTLTAPMVIAFAVAQAGTLALWWWLTS